MKDKTVYIVGYAPVYAEMFVEEGWFVVDKMEEANYVVFIGGADVTPKLYNEKALPETYCSDLADERDISAYEQAKALEKICLGICRGAQFLNVMAGGKLWQDVDGHNSGNGHLLKDSLSDSYIYVTSTHHQMMLPTVEGLVLATANEANTKTKFGEDGPETYVASLTEDDTEVVFYEEQKLLCFQPHPEMVGKQSPCRRYFFDLISHCFE